MRRKAQNQEGTRCPGTHPCGSKDAYSLTSTCLPHPTSYPSSQMNNNKQPSFICGPIKAPWQVSLHPSLTLQSLGHTLQFTHFSFYIKTIFPHLTALAGTCFVQRCFLTTRTKRSLPSFEPHGTWEWSPGICGSQQTHRAGRSWELQVPIFAQLLSMVWSWVSHLILSCRVL